MRHPAYERRRARETLDAKGRGPAHQDKKGNEVKGCPYQNGTVAPTICVIVAPGSTRSIEMEDLLMNIVSKHKADKQDSHDPQNGAVPTPHTMLFQTREAQTAQLVDQRNERHGHVVQVPQHGGIERRERLIFEDDLDHPQGTNGGDGNKAAAQDVVQAA